MSIRGQTKRKLEIRTRNHGTMIDRNKRSRVARSGAWARLAASQCKARCDWYVLGHIL